MKYSFPILFAFLWLSAESAAAQQRDAYFEAATLADGALFVIRLSDPALIKHARDIIRGDETEQVHVAGTIVKAPAVYNEPWSFHVDPGSITFFAIAAEVCDSSVSLIEAHLADVGGAFLPKSHWCPWSSRLLRELQPPRDPVLSVVSSASMAELAISPGSLASIFGTRLANGTESATGPDLPTKLAGVEVELTRNGSSTRRKARLLFVSPEQINFVVPDEVSDGLYSVKAVIENRPDMEAFAPVESSAPGLFFGQADGEKYAAATLLRVRPDGNSSVEPLLTVNESGEYVPVPVRFGSPDERLYLSLYGTGIGTQEISLLIDARRYPVVFSGPQGSFPGFDQINLAVPSELASKPDANIVVSVRSRDGEILESVPVKILGPAAEGRSSIQ